MSSNARRTMAGFAATATLLASVGTLVSTGVATAEPARCDLNEMTVQLVPGESGMSHRQVDLTVTNTSGSPCTISGYPETDGPSGLRTEHGSTYFNQDRGVHPVRLQPNQHAISHVEWTVPTGPELPSVNPQSVRFTFSGADGGAAQPWNGDAVAGGRLTVTALD